MFFLFTALTVPKQFCFVEDLTSNLCPQQSTVFTNFSRFLETTEKIKEIKLFVNNNGSSKVDVKLSDFVAKSFEITGTSKSVINLDFDCSKKTEAPFFLNLSHIKVNGRFLETKEGFLQKVFFDSIVWLNTEKSAIRLFTNHLITDFSCLNIFELIDAPKLGQINPNLVPLAGNLVFQTNVCPSYRNISIRNNATIRMTPKQLKIQYNLQTNFTFYLSDVIDFNIDVKDSAIFYTKSDKNTLNTQMIIFKLNNSTFITDMEKNFDKSLVVESVGPNVRVQSMSNILCGSFVTNDYPITFLSNENDLMLDTISIGNAPFYISDNGSTEINVVITRMELNGNETMLTKSNLIIYTLVVNSDSTIKIENSVSLVTNIYLNRGKLIFNNINFYYNTAIVVKYSFSEHGTITVMNSIIKLPSLYLDYNENSVINEEVAKNNSNKNIPIVTLVGNQRMKMQLFFTAKSINMFPQISSFIKYHYLFTRNECVHGISIGNLSLISKAVICYSLQEELCKGKYWINKDTIDFWYKDVSKQIKDVVVSFVDSPPTISIFSLDEVHHLNSITLENEDKNVEKYNIVSIKFSPETKNHVNGFKVRYLMINFVNVTDYTIIDFNVIFFDTLTFFKSDLFNTFSISPNVSLSINLMLLNLFYNSNIKDLSVYLPFTVRIEYGINEWSFFTGNREKITYVHLNNSENIVFKTRGNTNIRMSVKKFTNENQLIPIYVEGSINNFVTVSYNEYFNERILKAIMVLNASHINVQLIDKLFPISLVNFWHLTFFADNRSLIYPSILEAKIINCELSHISINSATNQSFTLDIKRVSIQGTNLLYYESDSESNNNILKVSKISIKEDSYVGLSNIILDKVLTIRANTTVILNDVDLREATINVNQAFRRPQSTIIIDSGTFYATYPKKFKMYLHNITEAKRSDSFTIVAPRNKNDVIAWKNLLTVYPQKFTNSEGKDFRAKTKCSTVLSIIFDEDIEKSEEKRNKIVVYTTFGASVSFVLIFGILAVILTVRRLKKRNLTMEVPLLSQNIN